MGVIGEVPGVVLAGTGSGVGKTSITAGIMRLLSRRGLSVQPFKVGPDYIDPTFLAAAAGRRCYNLDPWLSSPNYVQQIYQKAIIAGTFPVIEGVMGLFDGASPTSREGSTAEVAALVKAPVLLIINAHGLSRSIAAIAKGFTSFDPELSFCGVIANHIGSERHLSLLGEALAAEGLPPLIGGFRRDGLPLLPGRHLGLRFADENAPEILDKLADAVEKNLNLSLFPKTTSPNKREALQSPPKKPKNAHIAVARDTAFRFIYEDNINALEEAGAEITFFSPITDSALPPGVGGVYIPGGYPELHAEKLANNHCMIASIKKFAENGGCLYGECGGLIYLSAALTTNDGKRYPMAGILPIETQMLPKRKRLCYVTVELSTSGCWGETGEELHGHEFHYSEVSVEYPEIKGWKDAYTVTGGGDQRKEGYTQGKITIGYPHLHWASCPERVSHFILQCKG